MAKMWPPKIDPVKVIVTGMEEKARPSHGLPGVVGEGPMTWYGVAKTPQARRYQLWELATNGREIVSMAPVTSGDRNDLESVFTARVQDIFDALLEEEQG